MVVFRCRQYFKPFKDLHSVVTRFPSRVNGEIPLWLCLVTTLLRQPQLPSTDRGGTAGGTAHFSTHWRPPLEMLAQARRTAPPIVPLSSTPRTPGPALLLFGHVRTAKPSSWRSGVEMLLLELETREPLSQYQCLHTPSHKLLSDTCGHTSTQNSIHP